MPTSEDELPSKSIPLALQSLFYKVHTPLPLPNDAYTHPFSASPAFVPANQCIIDNNGYVTFVG
jgi:hypothetical protein